jgi:DNA-binding MarR family transcriptional regulator
LGIKGLPLDRDWLAVAHRMGYSPSLIRHPHRSIRATIILWVRHLRPGTGIVVFPRRTFRLYLVWQGKEKLKQRFSSFRKRLILPSKWLGVGIDLKTDKPTPEKIRVAVSEVLADRSYRNRAQDLQKTMSEYDTFQYIDYDTSNRNLLDSSIYESISTPHHLRCFFGSNNAFRLHSRRRPFPKKITQRAFLPSEKNARVERSNRPDSCCTADECNGAKSGTRLMRGTGITNARWQRLSELFALKKPVTLSELARHMGLTRQAIQRLADDMKSDGLVEFTANPGDARAMHLLLTDAGKATYHDALEREWQWTNAIAEDFDTEQIMHAVALLEAITQKMQSMIDNILSIMGFEIDNILSIIAVRT